MAAQHTQRSEALTGRRVLFTDNYYTSNNFARSVFKMTDGEIRVIGTVRLNYVDAGSKNIVQDCMSELKKRREIQVDFG